MNRWWITSPTLFYGLGALLVAYVLYMMIARRKGERADRFGHEADL